MSRYEQGVVGVTALIGCALTLAAVALPGKEGLAIFGYVVALGVGHLLAVLKAERILLPVLVAAVVYMPRVAEQPYPLPDLDTHMGPYLGFLAFATVGAAVTVVKTTAERRAVLLPAVLCFLGVLTNPDQLLQDPAVGWLSATVALVVLGKRWRTRLGGTLTLALIGGALSLFLLIPGYRVDIAILPIEGARPDGVFGNPLVANDSILLMTAAVVTVLAPRKLLAFAAFALGVTAAVWTGSRTGLLAMAYLVLAYFAGWWPRPRLGGRAKLAFYGFGAIIAYVVYFGVPSLGRAGGLSTEENSWVLRLAGFQDGLVGAFSHPTGTAAIEVSTQLGVGTTYENLFFDIGARMGWLVLAGTIVGFVLAFRLCTSTGRVQIGLLVLVGFSAAIYYHPAVYVIAFIGAGVMSGVTECAKVEDVEPEAVESGRPVEPDRSSRAAFKARTP